MTDWRCLDKPRIRKAVEESKTAFDPMDARSCSIEEFEHHMQLLNFRSDLFGIAAVIDHIERYRYRNIKALDFVIEKIVANSFSMEG
jgi:cytoplasmic iron level regulating protein YaaA (DUF328/UPF0246 family)